MKIEIEWNDFSNPEERLIAISEAIDEAGNCLSDANWSGSYSFLMCFGNSIPLRIRSNKPESIRKLGDKTTYAIDRWSETGIGLFVIRTSSRFHMRDIYPSKSIQEWTNYDGENVNSIFFHYYEGHYGNGSLWREVRNARNYNHSVGDAVRGYFQRNYWMSAMENIVRRDDDGNEQLRDFNYRIHDENGDVVVDIGRKGEEDWNHCTPIGNKFLGGRDGGDE
jgi:hypothetical protein